MIAKIGKYKIRYTNRSEFNILCKEIFKREIYALSLDNDAPLIYDLGAHIGLSLLYFKTKYPKCQIVAFEPNSNVFPILEENVECNDLKKVELHNIALGKESAIRNFYIDNSHNDCFSTGSFYKDAWNGKQPSLPIQVKAEPLSKFISKQIDLLKIDVEGAEREIVKELINSRKIELIKNIIIEYHSVDGKKPDSFVNLLKKYFQEITIIPDPDDKGLIDILGKQIMKEST